MQLILLWLDTYESALEAEKQIAATSQSKAESRIGKRKRKNNKYENYVSYPNPPRLMSSRNHKDQVLHQINFLNSIYANIIIFRNELIALSFQ